jgi:hypothetical protein
MAVEKGVIHHVSARSKGIKGSFYTDDAIISVRPNKQDISVLKKILEMFGHAMRAPHQRMSTGILLY